MANQVPPSPTDRIDRALARIEAATHARTRAAQAMADRHAALRTRIAEAITTLDAVMARGADKADES